MNGTEADFITNPRRPDPRNDEIARLAYALYEARGRRDGHDIEDWVLAKGELARRDAQSANTEELT